MCNNIEPLAPALWFQRIAVIFSGELGSIENSLRHAAHLVQLGPIPFRKTVLPILDESAFETLLEAGDHEAAARQLVAEPAALLIEPGSDSAPRRVVLGCPILNRGVDGSGETVAHAILRAWASRLVALRVEFGSDLDGAPAAEGQRMPPSCADGCADPR
jgi:hypothetical protein